MNNDTDARLSPLVVHASSAPSMPTKSRRVKPCQRADNPKLIRLTERDFELLCSLGEHRHLSSDQIQRLHFPGTAERRVQRRLRLLFDHGLLNRVQVTAQPTRGVPSFLHVLTDSGAQLAASHLGKPIKPYAVPGRRISSLTHQHLVNDFAVTLAEAVRGTGWRLSWRHEWTLKYPTKSGKQRPERVRVDDPNLGQPQWASVLPDGYIELVDRAGGVHPFFYELDLSTHSLRRWRQRAFAFTGYCDRARGNRFQHRYGHREFRLLVVATPDSQQRRARNIVRTIHKAVGKSGLFLVTSLDQLPSDNGQSLLHRPIWHRAGFQDLCPMFAASTIPVPGRVVVRPRSGLLKRI